MNQPLPHHHPASRPGCRRARHRCPDRRPDALSDPAPGWRGGEKFIEHCRQPAIENYLSLPNYHYQLAHIDGELAGVVAMRDNTHLFHMFVPRALHRRGMARRLWQAARDASLARGGVTAFTVNSSAYALPLYESLGFVATGPKVETGGIAFVPMRMEL